MRTKQIILITAFSLLIISCSSVSANDGGLGFRFGLKAGVNFSNISGTGQYVNADVLTGFQVGGLVEMRLSPGFAFSPEFLFTTKGAKTKIIINQPSSKGTITDELDLSLKLSYIEIPVLA